jgi:hypothetical protein
MSSTAILDSAPAAHELIHQVQSAVEALGSGSGWRCRWHQD